MKNTVPALSEEKLNAWAADIGNCKLALYNAIDCTPSELNIIGTLTIVCEKLNEMQEIICNAADKINP